MLVQRRSCAARARPPRSSFVSRHSRFLIRSTVPMSDASSQPTSRAEPRRSCPYCGAALAAAASRCEACKGWLDPLSRQATQNSMGPWFIRDETQPFRPGCNYETVLALIQRGRITPDTVLRGPTTGQFWREARQVPGVGHLFGRCHGCEHGVSPDAERCPRCGASFAVPRERQDLGLGPVHRLPTPQPRQSGGAPAAEAQRTSRPPAGQPARESSPPDRRGAVQPGRPVGPQVRQQQYVAAEPPAEAGRGPARAGTATGPPIVPGVRTMQPPAQSPRRRDIHPGNHAEQIANSPAQSPRGVESRRSPSTLALVLTAAALLLAVTVVVGAVFRDEIAGMWRQMSAGPTPAEPRSEYPAADGESLPADGKPQPAEAADGRGAGRTEGPGDAASTG